MKVAYLLGSLNRGGAETLVLDICKNARNQQLDILLIHRKNGQLKEDFVTSGVPLIQVAPRFPFDVFYFFKLRRKIIRNAIELVHAHQVIDAFYAYLATVFMPTKIILSFHGHGVKDRWGANLLRGWMLKNTELNLFVSRYQQQYYLEHFQHTGHSTVLHNGIDFTKFKVTPKSSIREELGIKAHELLVGSVGNFTSGRDQLTLCRFLALLRKEGISFKCLFVGAQSKTEPELYAKCRAYCEEQGLAGEVYFLGARADVPAILSQLNAFLYASAHDTFGIAVVEAMAGGIPVFVNDWAVMKEITREGQWATLYKTGDEKDLLAKFLALYQDREAYRVRSLKTAVEVKEQYGIENYLVRLKNKYTSLLTNHS